MARVKLEIVKTRKNSTKLCININNFIECSRQIFQAFQKFYFIKHNGINWKFISKQQEMLYQKISFQCLLLFSESYDTDYFSFLLPKHDHEDVDNNKNHIQVNNSLFMLKCLFRNKRIIYNWLNNTKKSVAVLSNLNYLMKSKHVISPKYTELIDLLTGTYIYWNCSHVLYLKKIGYLQSMAMALKTGYFRINHLTSPNLLFIINHTIKCFYILLKVHQNHNQLPSFDIIELFEHYVDTIINKTKKTRKKQALINYSEKVGCFKREINKFLLYYGKGKSDPSLRSIINKKMVKICGNIKCQKYNQFKCKCKKMKICKECKMIYYCSEKCQKYDWKYSHRNQCMILKLRL